MGLARSLLFFFNDTATTEIYTLSLHDALPISWAPATAPRSPSSWHSAAWRRPGRTGARCVHRHAARRGAPPPPSRPPPPGPPPPPPAQGPQGNRGPRGRGPRPPPPAGWGSIAAAA